MDLLEADSQLFYKVGILRISNFSSQKTSEGAFFEVADCMSNDYE